MEIILLCLDLLPMAIHNGINYVQIARIEIVCRNTAYCMEKIIRSKQPFRNVACQNVGKTQFFIREINVIRLIFDLKQHKH